MASQGIIDQLASFSFGAAPIAVDYIQLMLMGIKTGKGTIEFRSDNQHRASEILFFDLGGTQRVSFKVCDYHIEVIKEFFLVELTPNDTTRKRATIALTNRVSLEQFLTNMDKSRRQTSMKMNRPQYPIKKKSNSVHGSKIQSEHIETTAPTEDDSKTTSSSQDTGMSSDSAQPLRSVDSTSSSDGNVDGSESNRKSSSSDSEENISESPKRNPFKKSRGGAIKRKETKLSPSESMLRATTHQAPGDTAPQNRCSEPRPTRPPCSPSESMLRATTHQTPTPIQPLRIDAQGHDPPEPDTDPQNRRSEPRPTRPLCSPSESMLRDTTHLTPMQPLYTDAQSHDPPEPDTDP